MRGFCLLLFFLLPLIIHAQGYKISGEYLDEENNGIVGAEIQLINDSDSMLKATITDYNGEFEIPEIKPGQYHLNFISTSYQNISRSVTITNKDIHLGNITAIKGKVLDEVIIQGMQTSVLQKGDTSEYRASAYKTNPDATTEDLIRKMPGMDLSGNTPKSQGENITKVLVDGKEFFGEDVNATLRNMPAEVVQSIQVYDERSEQSQASGFDDGETTKTLNIVTRQDKKEGIFGKAYAGYGLPDFWNGGMVLNSFSGNQRITLLGQTNNINIQNFSAQDIGESSGRRRRRGGSDMMVDNKDGITVTNAVGLNYSNSWKDKLTLQGSYFYNHAQNDVFENTYRSYISTSNEGQIYEQQDTSHSTESNHRISIRLEYNPDSMHVIKFRPRLKIKDATSNSNLFGINYIDPNLPLNTTSNQYNTTSNNIEGDYFLLYNYKFRKVGRTISLFNRSEIGFSNADNYLMADNIFEDPDYNESINQYTNKDNNNWSTYLNINYTEPIAKNTTLQTNVGMNYQHRIADKMTYNFNPASSTYNLIDSMLSNTFYSDYFRKFAGLAVGYKDSIWMLNSGINYQNSNLQSEITLSYTGNIDRTFNNLLPFVAVNYNFTRRKMMRFRYRTSTNAPSITQLQDVIDNSNPLILRSGNPNLKQSYAHRIFTNYRSTNTSKNTNFFVMVFAQLIKDYIGNATYIADSTTTLGPNIILQPGMQYIHTENINGYYRLFSHMNYGLPITKIKSNLNISASLGKTRTPGLINNQKNLAHATNMNLGLTLSSNISENIDFTIASQSNYNIVKNTLNTRANNNYYNQSSRLDLNWIFYKGLFFNTNINHQYYTGLSSDFNTDFLLWNAALGYKFLKKRQAEIKISVYDILNRNQAISSTSNDIYIQDVSSNVLKRYAMATFTYNIRWFKGSASESDFKNKSSDDSHFHH